jgi:hypothetical protein
MNDRTENSPEQDNRFGLIVTVLLVVIIVALAGLWIVERGRRLRAETALVNEQSAGEKRMQSMGDMLVRQMTQTPSMSIQRDQLATQQVHWNGIGRTVLLLSASEGEKLGFQPGDAILITPPSATQPTVQKNTNK